MKFLNCRRSDDGLHGSGRKREEWNSIVALLSTKSIMLFGNKSRERLFRSRVYVTRFIIRSRKYESLSNININMRARLTHNLRPPDGLYTGDRAKWKVRTFARTIAFLSRVYICATNKEYYVSSRSRNWTTFFAYESGLPLFASLFNIRGVSYTSGIQNRFFCHKKQIFFLWQNSFLQGCVPLYKTLYSILNCILISILNYIKNIYQLKHWMSKGLTRRFSNKSRVLISIRITHLSLHFCARCTIASPERQSL